jgi:hypothetical protein
MPGFVIVGNPESRRVTLFQAALQGLGLPPARIVPWADLIANHADLGGVVRAGDVVRIESPGKEFAVERALIALGADEPDDSRYDRVSRATAEQLSFDKGAMLYPRQWFLGLRAALARVAQQLAACPPHRLMAAPEDILAMFDKRSCHARLLAAGVPVPRALGAIHGFDELLAAMEQGRCQRVFVKLAHGSSASGVVAYQTAGGQHHATTTVEAVGSDGGLRLYNSRRLRTSTDPREIAVIVDALCRHGVHVEQWLPKAGISGRTFDLRVVVIAGQARHTVVRLSRGPMTNLHLLNTRGELSPVIARMGPAAWEATRRSCEAAMAAFPASLYAGIDLLIASDFRRHAILELNAFGDLLPDLLWDGDDTYTSEIRSTLALCA